MKQLLEYIIPNIVNHPEDVVITESTDNGLVTLLIKVNPEDTGRVIGKAGKIINSIRQIVRVLAIKQGVRVNVEIDDGGQRESAPQTAPEMTPSEETV
jgi:predicted RNA-binding protein YlqC (UPF0109 family)